MAFWVYFLGVFWLFRPATHTPSLAGESEVSVLSSAD
jgi:hypothetical protein